MIAFVCLIFLMPPIPYRKEKLSPPKFPHLMDVGIKRISEPLGEKKALVILIDFSDNQSIFPNQNFDTLIYGTNQSSLRDYYSEVSYEKFTISQQSVISGWFEAPHEYAYYVGEEYGISGSYPNNAQGLVVAACSLADLAGLNFSDFDEDGDDIVDAIFIVHAGPGAEETDSTSHIWSHQWQLSNTNTGCPGPFYTNDGVVVDFYSMEPERFQNPSALITVGVFAHEFGHVLGLPDLYDYDYSTYGLGMFCLMAAGSWGRQNETDLPGSSPSHPCVWAKYQLGWLSPTALERIGISKLEDQSIVCAATNEIGYRLLENPGGADWSLNGGIGEYFMVENRFRTGFDKSLPGDGLLILHVDENITNNDNESHPLVGIMQADGNEAFLLTNLGEADDLWKDRTYGFGDTSKPASLDYAGNPTGVWVYDIGPADSIMNASLWVTPVLLGKVYSYPNPFRANHLPSWGKKVIITYIPSDTIELGQQFPAFKVTIYNIAAERVRILDAEPSEVDRYTRRAFWDLKNEKGNEVTSGMYLFIIETSGEDIERNKGRMTIVR